MTTIIGHERQYAYFNTVIARNLLAHAYVFTGPEHLGKLAIAKRIAQSFFCENKKSSKIFENICGVCTSCARIEENKDQNVFFLDTFHTLTSKKDVLKDIPIEDIRELKHQFSLRSAGGLWRVVIINEAEKLSVQAANAFLKLLEEPSEKTLFLLVTAYEELLMPTILSRAQIIRFGLVSRKHIALHAAKNGVSTEHAQLLADLSFGKPGIFMRLLNDKEFLESTEKRAKFMDRLLRSSIPDILRAAEKIAEDPDRRHEAVQFLFSTLHGILLRQAQAQPLRYLDAMKKIDHIQYVMETTNVNPRLALDVLFLEAKKVYDEGKKLV